MNQGWESGGWIFILVDWHGVQIFCLEDLIAVQAAYVIDAIAPCQDLSAGMLTNLHINHGLQLFYAWHLACQAPRTLNP